MSPTPLLWEEISRDWAGWWELGCVEARSFLRSQVCGSRGLAEQTRVPWGIIHGVSANLLRSCCQRGFMNSRSSGPYVNSFCTCWETREPGMCSLRGNGVVAGSS